AGGGGGVADDLVAVVEVVRPAQAAAERAEVNDAVCRQEATRLEPLRHAARPARRPRSGYVRRHHSLSVLLTRSPCTGRAAAKAWGRTLSRASASFPLPTRRRLSTRHGRRRTG